MRLSEIDVLSIGNTVQLAGAVYVGDGAMLLAMFPEDAGEVSRGAAFQSQSAQEIPVHVLNMTTEDWQVFLRQTDVMETEVLARAADGSLVKAVMRKSQRQIDQSVSWQVFRRDGYRCRYCGKDDVPLTVDHVVLWEDGGPSVPENLVSACRKCNRTRGNTPYAEWLRGRYYVGLSGPRGPDLSSRNEDVLPTIPDIPRRHHVHTR